MGKGSRGLGETEYPGGVGGAGEGTHSLKSGDWDRVLALACLVP